MRASIRNTSCGNSLQIHTVTSALAMPRIRNSAGVSSPAAISPAVTAAAPAINNAFTTLFAAMIRARDASSLRFWMIA